jgi:uncharacterized membrane protein YhaH (DUF805 family)
MLISNQNRQLINDLKVISIWSGRLNRKQFLLCFAVINLALIPVLLLSIPLLLGPHILNVTGNILITITLIFYTYFMINISLKRIQDLSITKLHMAIILLLFCSNILGVIYILLYNISNAADWTILSIAICANLYILIVPGDPIDNEFGPPPENIL